MVKTEALNSDFFVKLNVKNIHILIKVLIQETNKFKLIF